MGRGIHPSAPPVPIGHTPAVDDGVHAAANDARVDGIRVRRACTGVWVGAQGCMSLCPSDTANLLSPHPSRQLGLLASTSWLAGFVPRIKGLLHLEYFRDDWVDSGQLNWMGDVVDRWLRGSVLDRRGRCTKVKTKHVGGIASHGRKSCASPYRSRLRALAPRVKGAQGAAWEYQRATALNEDLTVPRSLPPMGSQ
ncbi:hypothetical protein FA13DRAFT_1782267 [Coprinellus micaceus]|uniref:Uncharacterized protein n=1 Tax=Coprinellus micaceus TaxID=71717 RepID=A0A4Y7S396_COPMI|nr:hypothetical protein FA13DRAFT_1782267 [Coprinellus micaceus]